MQWLVTLTYMIISELCATKALTCLRVNISANWFSEAVK